MSLEQQPLLPVTQDGNVAPESREWAAWTWLKEKAYELKLDVLALWYASCDPRAPLAAKALATMVLALILSPIDVVPDFIPILGILDDFILVPLGIWLAVKLIPDDVWREARSKAEQNNGERLPTNYVAGAIIVVLWALFAVWLVKVAWDVFGDKDGDDDGE